MNCRIFESQAPDWAAGRLSAGDVAALERHRDRCAACARWMQAEAEIRRAFRENSLEGAAEPDLWPRLAHRLEPRRRRMAPAPRLIWSGAAALALAALIAYPSVAPQPRPAPPGGASTKTAPGNPALHAPTAEALASLPSIQDVSAPNPAMDDPAGTSMEDIWTHINSENN
ncbi:hypothetical protein CCAX7_27160 [Capsulimonas corticalis]|uniref:Uncharacterized protein n=1 Tax=Capsulimonas corticalis TaxID=2219043 RepID=A0A402CTP9_9BACT|nr:hypothetical protein [Capsulimonas corticalis]BDI30665.1 hypothetical protein CCAX7_27160 [Capsulimonas corticalis]